MAFEAISVSNNGYI